VKKIVLSLTASVVLFGLLPGQGSEAQERDPKLVNESIVHVIPNPGSGITWEWYYTDYTSLSNDWYEKWYKYEDGAGTHYKVETYDSNGKLVKTRYL
jgi:hypothetical protein